MKKGKRAFCVMLCASMALPLASCAKSKTATIEEIFDSTQKISYCTSYDELSPKKENKKDTWRQGMVSGNGMVGFVESGSPYSDTMIFQNMHFIMPNENVRHCPDTSAQLETVKQAIVKGENITDDASYDDVYTYHPGGELRIDFSKKRASDYVRFTNYQTGETGVRFTDKDGTWERKSFTSKADGISVTNIAKSFENSKVNLSLSFDKISVLTNYGEGNEKAIQYKIIAGENGDYLAFVGHYPNYENSELKDGGYATVTYIITDGKKEVTTGDEITDEQYVGIDNPIINITDANNVYLLTVSDRTYNMGAIADFENSKSYDLVNSLFEKLQTVEKKYSTDTKFSYENALKAHCDIFTVEFNAVSLKLDKSQTNESNEQLIKTAKGEKEISSSLAEKAYYSGRYAYLSCAGYSTSRLYGMWTGEWNAKWGSKYTMDANVNLQTSSMNSGNLSSAPIGYACFILRQVAGWEENAMATHGFEDAIQAPVNCDGDVSAITETCYPYPFRYWNAGASWLLRPLFETLQTYGDISIPINGEYDLEKLKSVLCVTKDDLTEEQILEFKNKGSLDLKKDILLPLLTKSANYWKAMLTAEYYTDKNGDIHFEKGKTKLKDGETYCILPSYSPENNPKNYDSPSTANCAIDIAACRDNMDMLISVMKACDVDADTTQWEALKNKLPPYLSDDTSALKEWACNLFEENNEHRHLSHLYCAWPLNETQDDIQLAAQCVQAIANRESENEASHALIHRSLICARLKDRESLTTALTELMNSKIYYNSLMTNHNFDRSSCYCTDFEIGYLGIVNESLLYSNTGKIEILPALPTSGFESGSICGLRSLTRAEITSLSWNTAEKTAEVTIKSDIDQKIEISCGLSEKIDTVEFKANESKTLSFELSK